MKNLDGTKLTFQQKALSGFTEGELKCFFVFPHILNRLKMLDAQVWGHWTVATDASNSDPVRVAALCGVTETMFLTAGELKEAWEAIQQCFHASQVSKAMHPQLDADAQAAQATTDSLQRIEPYDDPPK